MNWTPGPARCRSPEYEAEIAFTDMGGSRPIAGRLRPKGQGAAWMDMRWHADGRATSASLDPGDIMPPTITREALAEECEMMLHETYLTPWASWQAIVAHVIDAVKAGRVE